MGDTGVCKPALVMQQERQMTAGEALHVHWPHCCGEWCDGRGLLVLWWLCCIGTYHTHLCLVAREGRCSFMGSGGSSNWWFLYAISGHCFSFGSVCVKSLICVYMHTAGMILKHEEVHPKYWRHIPDQGWRWMCSCPTQQYAESCRLIVPPEDMQCDSKCLH